MSIQWPIRSLDVTGIGSPDVTLVSHYNVWSYSLLITLLHHPHLVRLFWQFRDLFSPSEYSWSNFADQAITWIWNWNKTLIFSFLGSEKQTIICHKVNSWVKEWAFNGIVKLWMFCNDSRLFRSRRDDSSQKYFRISCWWHKIYCVDPREFVQLPI